MPTGWGRAALAGVEAALLSWGIPALLGILGLLAQADDPWLQQVDVSVAAGLGSDFWALSLGSPMHLGPLPLTLMPLGWFGAQILILRGLLGSGRGRDASSSWWSVPTYVATSFIALIASPSVAARGPVVLGAALVAVIAAWWAVSRQAHLASRVTDAFSPFVAGTRQGLLWFFALLLLGSVTVVSAAVVSWPRLADICYELGATGFSAFVLALAQLAYFPNFAAWALAWLAGPGFQLNPDVLSSSTQLADASLPALPVSALVPDTTPGPALALLVVAAGLCAGLVTGFRARTRPWVFCVKSCAASLATTAALIGVWMPASRGALGAMKLAHLGPAVGSWWVVFAQFALPAALAVLATNVALRRAVLDYVLKTIRLASGREPAAGENAMEWYAASAVPVPDESVAQHPGQSREQDLGTEPSQAPTEHDSAPERSEEKTQQEVPDRTGAGLADPDAAVADAEFEDSPSGGGRQQAQEDASE